MPSKKTAARTRAVLEALEAGATYAEAAKSGGISYQTLRQWRAKDQRFDQACMLSIEAGTDLIEAEARRRAVDGVAKPVGFHQGRHTGLFVRDYSDQLLVLLLKARRPELYRDSQTKQISADSQLTGAKDELLRKFAAADDSAPAKKTS